MLFICETIHAFCFLIYETATVRINNTKICRIRRINSQRLKIPLCTFLRTWMSVYYGSRVFRFELCSASAVIIRWAAGIDRHARIRTYPSSKWRKRVGRPCLSREWKKDRTRLIVSGIQCSAGVNRSLQPLIFAEDPVLSLRENSRKFESLSIRRIAQGCPFWGNAKPHVTRARVRAVSRDSLGRGFGPDSASGRGRQRLVRRHSRILLARASQLVTYVTRHHREVPHFSWGGKIGFVSHARFT